MKHEVKTNSMTKTKVTFTGLKKLMDKHYYLDEVDYRDNLSEQLDIVQQAIHGDESALDSIFEDYDNYENVQYAIGELRDRIETRYDMDEDEAQEVIDEYEDRLKDEIHGRNASEPLKDLLRNTGEQVFFYDTLYEAEDCNGFPSDETLPAIKKVLRIKPDDTRYDQRLDGMIQDAGYGGRLVIYFRDSIDKWINIKPEMNGIHFEGGINVAIINNENGSGSDCQIAHSFNTPFSKENLFLCKTVHYSYTYEVCSMVSDWCDSTRFNLFKRKTKKPVEKSNVNAHIEREKQLEETYRKGGCTAGDMKIGRHRDTPYSNDFPCGNRCTKCGTFWID